MGKSPKWTTDLQKTLIGFDSDKLDEVINRYSYDDTGIGEKKIYQLISNEFGKVNRYNRYITDSEKKIKEGERLIKKYTEMKNKYEVILEGEKETFGKILNLPETSTFSGVKNFSVIFLS